MMLGFAVLSQTDPYTGKVSRCLSLSQRTLWMG